MKKQGQVNNTPNKMFNLNFNADHRVHQHPIHHQYSGLMLKTKF